MKKMIKMLMYIGVTAFISSQSQLTASSISDSHWKYYQNKVLHYQTTIPGWCSPKKAKDMMDLIYEVKPEICVEVGVFGGSSIYPTASALKFLNRGIVYAIDSWSTPDCIEGYDSDDPNYQWWGNINLEQIYTGFINVLNRAQLHRHCVVMRQTGIEALHSFIDESIDILHIDGNHSEDLALEDAQMYLPKVKKGGYIWFDDINWQTTKKAWSFLSLYCTKDEMRSTDEYFLFRKN